MLIWEKMMKMSWDVVKWYLGFYNFEGALNALRKMWRGLKHISLTTPAEDCILPKKTQNTFRFSMTHSSPRVSLGPPPRHIVFMGGQNSLYSGGLCIGIRQINGYLWHKKKGKDKSQSRAAKTSSVFHDSIIAVWWKGHWTCWCGQMICLCNFQDH